MVTSPLQTDVFVFLGEKRDTSRQNGDISEVIELASDCPFMDLEVWVGFFELGLQFGRSGEVIVFQDLPDMAAFFRA
jgi:hypothetical protein